ncbi:unnamed protein product [Paramecium primaurelia]|uniref:Uncharacterized protein n=2 Tax=Paramecium TaxID=5884 RepID=A0A8S1YEE6_9CILI|nr:unnamed protein product [Paramecium primaurelia]CAD8209854.1 unnamed protein product [Paramecium pentaurelia]
MLQNNIDENEASLLFKFILIGDVAVGKTSLLKQFVEKRFCDDYNLTIGVEFNIKYIQVNDHVIKLQMWDTSGQENFKSVTRLYYRAAAGAIMVFDITRRETFENIRNWHREALDNGNSRMKFLLIGNKTDLQNHREVESYEAAQYAKENECLYTECSALQGSNVENAFMELAHQIYQMAMEDPNIVNEQYGIKYVNNANSSMSTSKIVSQNAMPKKQLQKINNPNTEEFIEYYGEQNQNNQKKAQCNNCCADI